MDSKEPFNFGDEVYFIAHETSTWQICPACHGRRKLPYAYTYTTPSGTHTESGSFICPKCEGRGGVWYEQFGIFQGHISAIRISPNDTTYDIESSIDVFNESADLISYKMSELTQKCEDMTETSRFEAMKHFQTGTDKQ